MDPFLGRLLQIRAEKTPADRPRDPSMRGDPCRQPRQIAGLPLETIRPAGLKAVEIDQIHGHVAGLFDHEQIGGLEVAMGLAGIMHPPNEPAQCLGTLAAMRSRASIGRPAIRQPKRCKFSSPPINSVTRKLVVEVVQPRGRQASNGREVAMPCRSRNSAFRQFCIALAGRKILARAFPSVPGRNCLTATGVDRSPTVNSDWTMRLSRSILTGRPAAAWINLPGSAAILWSSGSGTAGSLQTVEAGVSRMTRMVKSMAIHCYSEAGPEASSVFREMVENR